MGLLLNVAAGATAHVRAVLRTPRRRAQARRGARRAPSANRHDGPVSAAPSRIVIAAGGTAGHVVPALAVADALRAEGAEVAFIGGDRAEAELVPGRGLRAAQISVEGLSRTNPLRARARARARRARRPALAGACCGPPAPDAVLGGGGYVAGPGRRSPRSRCASRSC